MKQSQVSRKGKIQQPSNVDERYKLEVEDKKKKEQEQ